MWDHLAMNASQENAHEYAGIPTWTFGDKIRKARIVSGLQQNAFAAAVGITPSSLGAYETGRAHPRFDKAPKLAKRIEMLTGIPYGWFLVEDSTGPTTADGWAPTDSNRRPTDYRDFGPDELFPEIADLDFERARRRPSMVGVGA
jgi:transcriptional regulator with XRE-family HTH domain